MCAVYKHKDVRISKFVTKSGVDIAKGIYGPMAPILPHVCASACAKAWDACSSMCVPVCLCVYPCNHHTTTKL